MPLGYALNWKKKKKKLNRKQKSTLLNVIQVLAFTKSFVYVNKYEQERFIITDILEELLERSGRLTKTASTKYLKYRAPPNTREKALETSCQEDTCEILRLKGPDYRITANNNNS